MPTTTPQLVISCPRSRRCAPAADWLLSCLTDFSNHGRTRETFARVLQGSHVRLHLRLEGAFTKHGTSIPIRVLVVDKVPDLSKHR
jgi:hypothetical protein